jgi:NAD(P)-dependent dehydrogenase (short-subunit alcohol dehydrogenase family)
MQYQIKETAVRGDFDQGVALVAGGTGGIGSAVCRALANAGSNVAFTYRSKDAMADQVANEIRSAGHKADFEKIDLEDSEAIKSFVDAMASKYGTVHSVVYAAGPPLPLNFISALSPAEWKRVIGADVNGCFNFVWATLPYLKQQKSGSMVAVITSAVERAPPRDVLSAAPKAAIEMLFRGLACEEGRYGIRANCVGPGFIDAGLGHDLLSTPGLEGFVEGLRKSLPLRRFGQASDIADAVVFLLSSKARYITGQSIAVDGGLQL